jgi:uncharacterized protein
MPITPFYAALLALLFFVLSVRTLRLRRKLRIAVGDGGSEQMLRAMRVHSNFAEYVPLALLLNLMLESAGMPGVLVHALCFCLLMGRISHAYGVSAVAENYRYRVFGMGMTFTALVGAAGGLLVVYAWKLIA